MNLNKDTSVVIISHFSFKDEGEGEVFPQNIRNFLLKRVGKLTYIDHPFPLSNFPASQKTIFDQGVKSYQLTSPKIELPTLILFIYQFFLTIFFMLNKPVKYDLVIACDNLSFISVFILRRLGLIKKIIYYTVDYTPKRYENKLLNNLYQFMDKVTCSLSDNNWITVSEMLSAKVKNGLNLKKATPFQLVPIGFSKENIPTLGIEKVNRFSLIFVGVLYEKQGLQLVIKALPKLVKKYPKIKLTIIGSGPYESRIKLLIRQLHLNSRITFTGYINNHRRVVELLTEGGVGLATYDPKLGDYTYYADPSKIKLYLLCGLPVITTQVAPIAKEILRKKAGLVINYQDQDLLKALDFLFSENKYIRFRENALEIAKEFDNEMILNKAFKKL